VCVTPLAFYLFLSFYYFSLYFSLFVRSRNCELLP